MRYHVLAADYDGTLARHGQLADSTLTALRRMKESGRKLVLVTGRELNDLFTTFPAIDVCDRVVAENGAVIYRPATKETVTLVDPPPPEFARELAARIGEPVAVGRVIVATWRPHEVTTLELIRAMGLELQVIFNKGAVMILPSGVNKAVGLRAALDELELTPRNAVGVGDAENDHAFLSICECGVAVANALPALKERADWVTQGDHGSGIEELVEELIAHDLDTVAPRLARHHIALGTGNDGRPVTIAPYRAPLLFAGSSGGGKSTLATSLIEGLTAGGYQCCIFDPEGDFHDVPQCATLGDAQHPPAVNEVIELLAQPNRNVLVSMLAVPLSDRPAYFESLLPHIHELRARTGRPHWLVVDEAHHLAPANRHPSGLSLSSREHGLLLITVHPAHVAPALLAKVDATVAFGQLAVDVFNELADAQGIDPPGGDLPIAGEGEALVWFKGQDPFTFQRATPRAERRRHIRKYATGELEPDKSFFFRGREKQLNLRAHNLDLFLQIGDGVDEETWMHHLRAGDYSRWFRDAIKDDELAEIAAAVERDPEITAAESRARIKAAVESRYTAAA